MPRLRKIIRVVWPLAGLSFIAWLVYSSQSRGFPDSIMQSDSSITVMDESDEIRFIPKENRRKAGFIFFPGAMVDP